MDTMKIISSNIRFENPMDGENSWEKRRFLLQEIYLDFGTQILGTQEGRKPQIQNLAGLLPHLKLIDGHRDWISERMYPSLFFDPNLFSLLDSGDLWLSETPHIAGSSSFNSAFPRLCTWAIFRDQKLREFFVINTHLDHVLPETRERQIQVLLDELKEKIHSLPTILMGDFNEDPFCGVRKKIHTFCDRLHDPWLVLKKNEEPSYHQFKGSSHSGARIDWMLLSSELKVKNIMLDTRVQDSIFPSDHYPLKAEIILL